MSDIPPVTDEQPEPKTSAEPARPMIADLSPSACAARLAELYPALFTAGAPKPLKLRIQADIQARSPGIFSRKSLSAFLHRHTTATAYLKALVNSPSRIDLDGVAAGEIADEHRQAAVAELERRRTAHEGRRTAEREAQRKTHREAQQQAMRDFAAQSDARRERAGLLRAFESTTLTLSNFCALKGLSQTDLEASLALARQDREQAAKNPVEQSRPPRKEAREGERRPRPQGQPRNRQPRPAAAAKDGD